MKVAPYHTNSTEYPPEHRNVYHDHDDCPDGKRIKPQHRVTSHPVALSPCCPFGDAPLLEDRSRRAPRLLEARPPANVVLLQPLLGQLPELGGVVVEGIHYGRHRRPLHP